MSLPDWLANRWLVEHETGAEEIAALLAIAQCRGGIWPMPSSRACRTTGSSVLATTPHFRPRRRHLPRQGFGRRANNTTSAPSRALRSRSTGPTWTAKVDQFDRFRKKRNIGGYEIAGMITGREAQEMHDLAAGLRDDVVVWLRRHHPKLLAG